MYRSAHVFCMQVLLCRDLFGNGSLYVRIAVLLGINVLEWHAVLHQALGDCALPYDTVARWVQAFRSRRVSTVDVHCSGHSVPIHTDMSVAIIEQCMDEDRC
jgi:hypothetical protein